MAGGRSAFGGEGPRNNALSSQSPDGVIEARENEHLCRSAFGEMAMVAGCCLAHESPAL